MRPCPACGQPVDDPSPVAFGETEVFIERQRIDIRGSARKVLKVLSDRHPYMVRRDEIEHHADIKSSTITLALKVLRRRLEGRGVWIDERPPFYGLKGRVRG